MRTRISYQPEDGPIEPCGDTDWGEVEDYTITITDPLGLGDNVIDFNIYPNPSEDIFNVDLSGFNGEATEIVITDITGRVISTINTPEQFMQLDLRDESKGIYFVTVYTENNAHTKKITKF